MGGSLCQLHSRVLDSGRGGAGRGGAGGRSFVAACWLAAGGGWRFEARSRAAISAHTVPMWDEYSPYMRQLISECSLSHAWAGIPTQGLRAALAASVYAVAWSSVKLCSVPFSLRRTLRGRRPCASTAAFTCVLPAGPEKFIDFRNAPAPKSPRRTKPTSRMTSSSTTARCSSPARRRQLRRRPPTLPRAVSKPGPCGALHAPRFLLLLWLQGCRAAAPWLHERALHASYATLAPRMAASPELALLLTQLLIPSRHSLRNNVTPALHCSPPLHAPQPRRRPARATHRTRWIARPPPCCARCPSTNATLQRTWPRRARSRRPRSCGEGGVGAGWWAEGRAGGAGIALLSADLLSPPHFFWCTQNSLLNELALRTLV